MKQKIKDIYQYEIDPSLYLKRARDIRRRNLEELIGGIGLLALIGVTFTFVQIAYGIW